MPKILLRIQDQVNIVFPTTTIFGQNLFEALTKLIYLLNPFLGKLHIYKQVLYDIMWDEVKPITLEFKQINEDGTYFWLEFFHTIMNW